MLKARAFGLRINQYSVLSNHVHLIAEIDGDKESLKRSMMSFNGRLGRWLRKEGEKRPGDFKRKFKRELFKGRYDVRILKTPRQMKNALEYVLLNASKHFRKCPSIDRFSSGADFDKWPKLLKERFDGLIRAQVMSLREFFQENKKLNTKWDAQIGKKSTNDTLADEMICTPITWLGRVGRQRV